MSITLRQLRYLQALAEHRHFGRAAEACHVSQPALSVQIRELEATLGAALCERGRGEVTLTALGREIAARAERVLAEVREIEQTARWSGGLAGRLSLGVIPTVAPYLLPAALPLLRARDLELDLGVREAQTAALLAEVRDGRLDAAVVALPSGDPGLAERVLFRDAFLLAARAGLAAPAPRPEDLAPERLLLLEEGHCLADQTLEACRLDRARTRMDLRASSLSTLARLAAEGFGYTLLPEIAMAAEQAAAPGLEVRRFAAPEPSRLIGLVRRRITPEVGWFDELAEILVRAWEALDRPA